MAAPTSARPRLTRARAQREPEMGRWGSDKARRPRTHRRGRLREGRGGRSGGDGHGEGTRRRGAPSRTCRPRPAPVTAYAPSPRQQVHVLCWERHTCERRPEQTRLCPRQARLPPRRRGCFLAWATRPAEEPGRVRGQSAAGSRGCVCPCALGSPTAALTTPLQRLRHPTCLLSLTGRFPVRPQLPAGKRVAKFAE